MKIEAENYGLKTKIIGLGHIHALYWKLLHIAGLTLVDVRAVGKWRSKAKIGSLNVFCNMHEISNRHSRE
jgi:hypothetical protein